MVHYSLRLAAVSLALTACAAVSANTYPLAFTRLTGLTGGWSAETAVFRADLSGAPTTEVLSLSIRDSTGNWGDGGIFGGFDLDAVRLSDTSVAIAADSAALAGMPAFDFGAGAIFAPGAPPLFDGPNLFGATGNAIREAVATLGTYGAVAEWAIPRRQRLPQPG